MDASSVGAKNPVLQDTLGKPENEGTGLLSPAGRPDLPITESSVSDGTQLEGRTVKELYGASDNSKDLSRCRTVIKWILDKLVEWRWLSDTLAKNLLTRFLIEIDNKVAKSNPTVLPEDSSPEQSIPEEIIPPPSESHSTVDDALAESNTAVLPEDPSPEQSILHNNPLTEQSIPVITEDLTKDLTEAAQKQTDSAIQDLVSKTKALISKTEGNEDITESYGEYRKAAEQIGLIKPIAADLDFIAEFNKLGICPSDPAKQTKLNDLIEKLHAKSPEMLAGILNNCQWLVGKAKPEFIFSVAVESMQMELADIFDQNGFNALPKGIQPAQYIMYGNTVAGYDSLLDTNSDNVIKETYKKFKSWLEARHDLPITKEQVVVHCRGGTKQPQNSWEMYSLMWLQWQVRGGFSEGMFSVRQAVLDTTLETKPFIQEKLKKALDESRNSPQYWNGQGLVPDVSLAPYIPISYAYTQLLMRHATFPGHDKGPPPTLLAVRKVPAVVFGKLTGKTHNYEDTGKERFSYTTDRALPAESWSTVSQVYGNCGESAIYGHVPAYSVLTSVFAHDYKGPNARDIIDSDVCGACQRELVVLPFSDIEVTIEPNFDQKRYAEEVMFPAMEKQYGSDHDAIGNARRHWHLKG